MSNVGTMESAECIGLGPRYVLANRPSAQVSRVIGRSVAFGTRPIVFVDPFDAAPRRWEQES